MANSNTILDWINDIAGTSSKNEKLASVIELSTDADFVKVLEYAYNPFKTYGIKQIPERVGSGSDGHFIEDTWQLLDKLAFRELTGTAARQAVADEINRLSENSADLFIRILRKDLRAGFSESTINKAVKGLIPEFPYMRCSLPKDAKFDTWDWERGAISQEKADGMFANVNRDGGVSIHSRQGSEFPLDEFDSLVSDVEKYLVNASQNHGEIVVERNGQVLPREIGNGILNSILQGGKFEEGDRPVFLMWDQIPILSVKPKGKCDTPYYQRLGFIKEQLAKGNGQNLSVRLIETRIVHSLGEAMAHYRELLKKGKEGVVVKNPNAIWKDGTSKDQIKLKLEADVDLKIIGIVAGKEGGKNEGRAGSLTCETSDGLLRVDVTVKNEAMRDSVDAANDDWIGRVITVRANAILEPSESNSLNSLFLPRMVEPNYRHDKSEADSLQRVRDQFDAAIKAA